MLGGSLAAQPEHETISVNRMLDHPPSLNGFLGIWLYHTGLRQLPSANCQLPIRALLIGHCLAHKLLNRIVIGTWQLAIGNG